MYLLTIEGILGSAGLKDVTKGVRSVLADSVLAIEGLRDAELSVRDSRLFVVRCGYNHV